MSPEEQEKIIKQCVAENPLAQRQLYEAYAGRLYAVCLRYLNHREDAQEALSNTWIKVFDNISRFRFESALNTWMTKIAVRECLMMLRKKNVFFQSLNEDITQANYVLENHNDEVEYLQHIIESLPVGFRTVFNLYAIEGYGHKEIAEMLGISESTSKSQLSRARSILRKKVEQNVFNYER
ncbi:MAG: sigma-70 family RNA polymerase sigma factor [Cryomorphaceae bacterium]|nr:sigma-70 family RNA polymerase sigma factor [Cryomorphaceae bacterium]